MRPYEGMLYARYTRALDQVQYGYLTGDPELMLSSFRGYLLFLPPPVQDDLKEELAKMHDKFQKRVHNIRGHDRMLVNAEKVAKAVPLYYSEIMRLMKMSWGLTFKRGYVEKMGVSPRHPNPKRISLNRE